MAMTLNRARILASFAFVFVVYNAVAQPEHFNWVLDGDILIDFSTGVPDVKEEPLKFSTIEAAASVSDSLGNLLFYTNGVEVYNRLGEVISEMEIDYNDTTFFKSYTQGVLILPEIGQESKFRIVGIGRSAIVDMNMAGGLGGMFNSPSWIPFDFDTLSFGEKNIAIRHANGRDWWILQHRVIPDFDSDRYDSLLITYLYDRNGIRLTNINRINLYSAGITTQYGEMSFSPLGDKVAMALHGSFAVYEFDRCEGRIGSEIMHIDTIHRVYGCAFSPNGKFVYISTTSGFGPGSNIIYQVSLSPDQFSNFPVSEIYKQQAGGVYGNGQLEIGPDGKIYSTMGCRFYGCGTSVKNTTLSVINYPDLEGLACDFDTFTISLSDKKTWFALPNMVNYALGALEGSDCDTLGGSTAVPETATLPQWEITPTVSTGWYSFNGPEQVLLLVYDVWGRTVWQGSATGRRIDLSDLPSGLYLVQAKWEQRQETFRILKQ